MLHIIFSIAFACIPLLINTSGSDTFDLSSSVIFVLLNKAKEFEKRQNIGSALLRKSHTCLGEYLLVYLTDAIPMKLV